MKNNKNNSSRYNTARKVLIFWTLFVGIGAVAGAWGMLADPSGKALGMDAMLPYFQVLPFAESLFQNFVFSGIMLLVVNGLTNLVAACLLFANKKIGAILGGVFGITLMAWICIQFCILPFNFMSTIYFVFGVCQAIAGVCATVFHSQESFHFNEADYPNIGTNPKLAVVYFSRMGYTKKLAYERANATGAVVHQIKTTERTEGTLGFWWCGRFSMHNWDMPLVPDGVDYATYDSVTICTPVWMFSVPAPVKTFCKAAGGSIKQVNYVVVHFMNARFQSVADEMDNLLGAERQSFVSVRCRYGKFKQK